jgi:exodeoxyribonuclease VII large subunit
LENNYGKFQFFVTLFEATMQGDVAVPSILNAFDRIFQTENQFDMVAIIRGGGAVADLSCFDNYELAFTVTQFSLPVITGIGHEKDDTIVDMVAHTRLKTPTAVAEFLIRGVQRFLNHLNEKGNAVMQRASEITGHEELRINRLINRFGRTGSNYISMKSDQVSQLISKFHRSVKEYTFRNSLVLNGFRHSILHQTEIFIRNIRNAAGLQSQKLRIFINGLMIRKNDQLIREEENLKLLISELISREKARQKALNRTLLILKPENILNRGFTLTFHEGRIIKKMKNLETGDEIVTRFSDGMVHSEISKKIES